MQTRCDVLIVGFGPVGAAAACLLDSLGVSTIVIDRSDTIYDKPRAVALDHEIARILQNVGLTDALDRCTAPFSPSEYFGVDGQLIRRLDMLPPPYPLSWTPSMVFMQPALEAAMRERAAELTAVAVELGVTLTGVVQDTEQVIAQVQHRDGTATTIACRYLLACDGASSTVRQLLAIPFDDLDFDQPWLVVDVVANPRGLAKLPAVSAQYCQPARPSTYIVGVGNHRRWELMLHPGEDPRRMEEPAEVWRLLSRWIGPDDASLWRAASYRFHALIARRWRDRRVLLAGDAAHQQPPFLGQGLCQGIRDAANIAWKLERVLRGTSPATLLDSYQTERGEHVKRLTQTIKGIGAIVSERDEARARARDARLLAEAGGTVTSQPRQDLMPALQSGCLSTASPARGMLFPQPMIATSDGNVRMDAMTGTGLRVVLQDGVDIVDADVQARVKRLGGRIIRMGAATGRAECDDVLDGWFRRNAACAAIVRPDHAVFATAATQNALVIAIGDLERALS